MQLFQQKKMLITLLATFFFIGCQNDKTDLHAQTTANDEAKLVLVEYADFQCPTCAYFYGIVKKLKKHYGDQLVVKYRYFPLKSHRYSMLAARAAEAARNQGKFEEMKHLLYTNQDTWASSSNAQQIFIDYAKQIGLDIEQFKKDLNSLETQRIVRKQKNEGIKRGVRATPTFFINGEKMTRLPRSYAEFKALLDIYLKEAKKKKAST